MSSNIQQTDILETYSSALLPIYEEVCGDPETYPLIKNDFNQFLLNDSAAQALISAGKNAGNMAPYARSLLLLFLGDGRKCHEQSPAGRSIQVSFNMHAQSMITISRLYDEWLGFMTHFTALLADLERAIRTTLFLPDTAVDDQMQRARPLLVAARRAEFAAEKISYVVKDVLILRGRRQDMGLEGKVIDAQLETLNEIREHIRTIIRSIPSARVAVRTAGPDLFATLFLFKQALADMDNPLQWVKKVYTESEEGQRMGLTFSVPERIPDIKPGHAQTFREIMDRIVISAAGLSRPNEKVGLDFSWDGARRAIVIASRDLQRIIDDDSWNHVTGLLIELRIAKDIVIADLQHGAKSIAIPIFPVVPPPSSAPADGNGHGAKRTVIGGFRMSGEAPASIEIPWATSGSTFLGWASHPVSTMPIGGRQPAFAYPWYAATPNYSSTLANL